MEELENTNPTMDNPEQNSATPNDLEAVNPTPEQQQSPDLSQLFSENIAENTPAQENVVQEELVSSTDTSDLQTNSAEAANLSQTNIQDNRPQTQENEIDIPETNFDKVIEHTELNNSPNVQTAQPIVNEQQRVAIEQQKLAWLKEHESKAKKSGFAKGMLSGIILLLLAFVACSLFAKEQVIDAMDYLQSLIPTNNTNTNPIVENIEVSNVDLSNTEEEVKQENTEEVNSVQEYYNKVDEIVSSESDQENKAEQLKNILTEVMQTNEEPDEELTQYISQAIMDLTINSEESQDEKNIENEEISEEKIENPESNNEIYEENNDNNVEDIFEDTNNETIEEENTPKYTITHVDSEEEANWVLPSHCSDLTCYGEYEEFIECTSFRMIETLDENTTRVSSRGGCKYKDTSELVYVEFN